MPMTLSTSLDGEAREVARVLASILADTERGRTGLPRSGVCLLAGGETTVTVRGDGVGGRNLEAALAAALRLEGVPGVAIGFLATDGDDGETGVAGAIVTGQTIDSINRAAAREALSRNDSYTFLIACSAVVRTGPTGTNVNDLVIGVITG
jgi:glycerate-2-kinase